MKFSLILACSFCCAAQTAHPQESGSSVKPPAWAAPNLSEAVSVRDGRSGETLSFSELLEALAKADAVFLGETHIDETTHRVELAVLEGLWERRENQVTLAMEMFERDEQDALDAYLKGETSEEQFLRDCRPWGNYASAYRPMIEFAKRQGLRVLGSNFPNSLRRELAMGTIEVLDDLPAETRALAPNKLFANSPDYWRRVDNAVRGHIEMMGIDPEDTERLYATQSLWDNSMGETCALALQEDPDGMLLHVNGGFHSSYWDGTVRQLRLRQPQAKIVTVAISPSANPAVSHPSGAPRADYIVYAESRARDLNEGMYAVHVQREVKYRLHLPEKLSMDQELPLLIWLSDDGFSSEDGMQLWRERLGGDCIIAVLEAPYRETQEDLVQAGRWYWPESFAQDLGSMQVACEKIWAYLQRYYPIDPNQICIAGEGTGATVVAATALASERMKIKAVAFEPRHYAKLKDIPLPLPEFRADLPVLQKSLQLILRPGDADWWQSELRAYQEIGFESGMRLASEDPWLLALSRENTLRSALGLEAHGVSPEAPRRHVLAEGKRAQMWARLLAGKRSREDGSLVAVLDSPPQDSASLPLEVDIHALDFEDGKGIPSCPGPFGGTTVIVLPEGTDALELEAWLAIEENDPLNARNRFTRLRVATSSGELTLQSVLTKLAEKGRKNVLIIPAMFCAEGQTMRSLRASARGHEESMSLHWRPGLGG